MLPNKSGNTKVGEAAGYIDYNLNQVIQGQVICLILLVHPQWTLSAFMCLLYCLKVTTMF